MIDKIILEGLDHSARVKAIEGILLLCESGILELQKQSLFARVSAGADNEDPEALAKRILEYREKAAGLIALQHLGESLKEELQDESEK